MKKWLVPIIIGVILLSSCSGNDSGLTEETTPRPAPTQKPLETPTPELTDDDANETNIDIDVTEPKAIENPSPITGLEMNGEYKPVAVIVENFAAARPQSGIIDADLVYEANAEGGITRFLAVFLSKRPEIVGPVRSVRHYYMWMAQEWDALLVHYGQSFIAEDMFNKVNVKRLNGFYDEKLFWRDKSRKAPHNFYIDINDCLDVINFDQDCKGFKFSMEPVQNGKEYKKVTIPYNRSNNVVSYEYDAEQDLNMRFINGKKDTDRESGKQYFAKNIIIQHAKHSILEPGAGYRDVKLVDKGKAKYFIGGRYFEGTWERKSYDSQTVFYDESGNEIALQPGNTWVQIVQEDLQITVE